MPQQIVVVIDWLAGRPQLHASISICLLILLAWIANLFVKRILVRGLCRQMGMLGADREARQSLNKVIARLANIVPALLIYGGVGMLPALPAAVSAVVQNTSQAFIVITIALALSGMLNLTDSIYQTRPGARSRPIKGYLQLCKIALYAVTTVLVIATLFDRSPLILLSGIGAMAAVLMLIFQDTLLSMVASVQISSSGMIRVGDWVEMPQLNADGAVIDIALHTVKVQNWDLTITAIPTKRLIGDAFKNWRGMQEKGARRIKRALFVDQNSIKFIDEKMCVRLKDFSLLDDYLERKQRELDTWNAELAARGAAALNARKASNIGTFRAYIERYLRNHPAIRQDMTLIVRQLSPTSEGLPLEIYCFSNTTVWAEYERIQSDIFDHLLAIIAEFDLRVFQRPGGADMQALRLRNSGF
ncbi:MAG: mechanosensitive ion channel family protein [Herbaspirillum sp.]|nr:mechanosensitive ion channel family protein [Herbaspirillum sp.]